MPNPKPAYPAQFRQQMIDLVATGRRPSELAREFGCHETSILSWMRAATLFLNGEPETARLILRDLVNATIGFEQLATLTAKPSKSLHRMLSPTGNPSMDNLAAIFRAVRERLQVSLQAHSVAT